MHEKKAKMTAIEVLPLAKRKVDSAASAEPTEFPTPIAEASPEIYEVHCGGCSSAPVALTSFSPSPTGLRIDYFCVHCQTDGCVEIPFSKILGLPQETRVH